VEAVEAAVEAQVSVAGMVVLVVTVEAVLGTAAEVELVMQVQQTQAVAVVLLVLVDTVMREVALVALA